MHTREEYVREGCGYEVSMNIWTYAYIQHIPNTYIIKRTKGSRYVVGSRETRHVTSTPLLAATPWGTFACRMHGDMMTANSYVGQTLTHPTHGNTETTMVKHYAYWILCRDWVHIWFVKSRFHMQRGFSIAHFLSNLNRNINDHLTENDFELFVLQDLQRLTIFTSTESHLNLVFDLCPWTHPGVSIGIDHAEQSSQKIILV